jgi:hypothetical protein
MSLRFSMVAIRVSRAEQLTRISIDLGLRTAGFFARELDGFDVDFLTEDVFLNCKILRTDLHSGRHAALPGAGIEDQLLAAILPRQWLSR